MAKVGLLVGRGWEVGLVVLPVGLLVGLGLGLRRGGGSALVLVEADVPAAAAAVQPLGPHDVEVEAPPPLPP